MNRTCTLSIVALSLATAAGTTFADDITIDPHPFVSTKSRAEVMQEFRQHRQAGVSPWADHYDQLAGFQSGRTRADVRAEFLASREAATALSSEDSGSSYLARMNTPPMRRHSEMARADK